MSDVIEVTNPASGEVITEVRSYRIEEARQALERARRAVSHDTMKGQRQLALA